jgi:hypothetical protein
MSLMTARIPDQKYEVTPLELFFDLMVYYKLAGHHHPGRQSPDPLVDVGRDASGPVHERFGDQGLHHLRLGLCHSAAADSTGSHRLDTRKFN